MWLVLGLLKGSAELQIPWDCPHGRMLLGVGETLNPLGFVSVGGCCRVFMMPTIPGALAPQDDAAGCW